MTGYSATRKSALVLFLAMIPFPGLTACFGQAAAPASPAPPVHFGLNKVSMTVVLTSPISTKNSKVGDPFTASVDDANFPGAVMEGHIRSLKKPKRVGKDKAQISFGFDSFTFNNQTGPILADLKEVSNSKGAKGVDEEGDVVGKPTGKGRALKTLAAVGGGAAIGALAGGAKGAAVGAAAGLALGLTFAFSAKAEDIEFYPGSRISVVVSDNTKPPNTKAAKSKAGD
jgi:hypothetical protein